MRMVVRFFSTLASFVALVGCTAPSKPALYSPRPYEQGTDPPLSKLALVGTGASQRDRQDLREGILRARSLEADLPRELSGTRYAMEYFSMSRLAPEAFLMVVAEPGRCLWRRRVWFSLPVLRGRRESRVSRGLFRALSGLEPARIQGKPGEIEPADQTAAPAQ